MTGQSSKPLPLDPSAGREPIGSILLGRGKVTEQQLKEALQRQEIKKTLLGEILVELGYVEEIDIVVAVVLQCGLPYIAVNKYSIDRAALKLIPEPVARQFHVIALDKVGEILSVVMADPLNRAIVKRIEEVAQSKVAPFIATKTEIDQAINQWYRSTE